MTAEQDIGNALQNHLPLAAIVGQNVYLDEVPESQAKPFILFSKSGNSTIDRSLENVVLHRSDPFAIACVGRTRAECVSMRELVEAALLAVNQPASETQSGYDQSFDAETETVLVDWWT